MAEERIILTVDDGYCKEKCSCFPIACSAECEHLDKPTFSYTRQEAIERMAKAMCHNPYESCEGCIARKKKQACKQALEGMKELAEAALNALLEG